MDITEKWRPKCFEYVIGQKKAVRQIMAIRDKRGYSGTAWWIAADASGNGKTTLAKIMAGEFATELTTCEMVGRDLLADDVRNMMAQIGQPTLLGKRAWIINEAQDISSPSVCLLLDAIERVKESPYDLIIFTSMRSAEHDSDRIHEWALISRCYIVDMEDGNSRDYREALIEHLEHVAQVENISAIDFESIADSARWSIRGSLAALELYGVIANLPSPILYKQNPAPIRPGDRVLVEKMADAVLVHRVMRKSFTVLKSDGTERCFYFAELRDTDFRPVS